jgi:enoyl-CoA hydratase/carnithine racemase
LLRNIINSISAALPEILNDPRTNVIVIRGSGGKAFCAGGDIKALHGAGQQVIAAPARSNIMRFIFVHNCLSIFSYFRILMHLQISGKPSPQMRFFKSEYLADLSLALASKPVVSLIDGSCLIIRMSLF